MMNQLAQVPIPLAPIGGFRGKGIIGLEGQAASSSYLIFSLALSKIIGVITVIGFIWFTFLLLLGAIGILTSGGDKGTMENSKKRLTSGVIGLVLIIGGLFLANLIGTILGVGNILNINTQFCTLVGIQC